MAREYSASPESRRKVNAPRAAAVAQSEFRISRGVIPKRPRFYERAEGSPVAHSVVAGDPSLRLKNGYVQDDAIDDEPDTIKNSN